MKKGSIIKSTVIVMIVAVLSKFIGAFRDILITGKFGATVYTDAYKLSAAIPDTIFMIIGLAISTSFLPMLSRVKVKKGTSEMHKFANNIINILFIVSLFIFILSSIFPEVIVNLLAKEAGEETIRVTISLTRIILLNIIFLSVNACFTALLQVHEDFVIPSILGLFFNLPIILYLLIFKDFNVYGLTIANVLGNFLRVLVQIPPLLKHGYRYKMFIDLKDERVRRLITLIIPVVIGAGANSINLVVDKRIASGLGSTIITNLDNAQLLITFVTSMINTAISNVLYPVLANKISEGRAKESLDILKKTIIYLGLLLIPITFGILIYGFDAVKIVFVHGNYTESDAKIASFALLGYAIGLFFTGIRDILNSTLFSMGQTRITAKNGCIGVAINVTFSIILSRVLGVMGIAIASSLAMIVTSMLLVYNVIKINGDFTIKDLIIKVIKIIIASVVMALSLFFVSSYTTFLSTIIHLLVGVIVGCIIYLICVYILKVSELKELISIRKTASFSESKK